MINSFDSSHLIDISGLTRLQRSDANKKSIFEKYRYRNVSDKNRTEFCVQLSFLLQAKISLHRALQSLEKQTKNPRMKEVISTLEKEVRKGNSFAKALASRPDVFDNLFVMTAEVGQESGRLAEVMSRLGEHLEKINSLRRKVKQALAYPALVLSVAVVVVLFLLLFIVPTFGEMFKNFQMELPLSTSIILSVSQIVSEYGMYAVGLLILGVLLIRSSIKKVIVREKLQQYIFRIPVINDILLKNLVARFCRTLGTLLQAQVSLLDALEVVKKMITNSALKQDIQSIIRQVRQGKAIAEPIIDSVVFPPIVSQMIAVGEETSELDVMLLKVADYFEMELDSKVETLSSVVEPILILILGLIVAAILISMYLPMFDLVNMVGGGG
jgi:type IV pilus assembly protein PilC